MSLIVATKDRVAPLDRLLDSLERQTFKDFEVLVVDQNPDDRLAELLGAHGGGLDLRCLRSTPGASKARNVGLEAARGEWVGFPDDDCWYDEGLLEHVLASLSSETSLGGIMGQAWDPELGKPVYPFEQKAQMLEPAAVGRTVCAIGMFCRRDTIADRGGFDERMGPGAPEPFGGMEEHDLVLRLLAAGARLRYQPELRVFHPSAAETITPQKAYRYAAGAGRIAALYPGVSAPLWRGLLRSLGGCCLSLVRGDFARAEIQWGAMRGRWHGYWMTKR